MKRTLLTTLILLALPAWAWGATYYLRADGTDADPDCSESSACCAGSLDLSDFNGDGESFSAGDIIKVCDDGGNYTGWMSVPASGSSGNPIVIEAAEGDSPVWDLTTSPSGWDTGGNWTATWGSDLVTDGAFANVEGTGSELLTNGDMELDANWVDYFSPTTNERSGDQTHGGSYSWKVVADGAIDGTANISPGSLPTSKLYQLGGWVYPDDTSTLYLTMGEGDGGNIFQLQVHDSLNQDAWNYIVGYGVETDGGALNQAILIASEASTFYADDWSWKEATFTSWTEGTGWIPEAGPDGAGDEGDLRGKAIKIAGTASDLEQTGLTATAGVSYQVVFTVADRTAGSINVEFGSTDGTSRSTNDTFTETIVAADTDHLKFEADSSFDGTIDTVTVKLADTWYLGSIATHTRRVWMDGTEYIQAQNEADVDATYRWWWDDPNDRLYVYSPQNPADEYTTIQHPGTAYGYAYCIYAQNKSHLTFKNLDLRGSVYGLSIQSSTGSADIEGITIDSMTIGYNVGLYGIFIVTFDDAYDITGGEIKNCTLDSNFHLNSGDYSAWEGGLSAVVLSAGAQYWTVHDNTITDWAHNAVIVGGGTDREAEYNEIYDNTIECPQAGDCKAWATGAAAAATSNYNEFYRNLVTGMETKLNLGGTYNQVYYNIFGQMTSPSYDHSSSSCALAINRLSADSTNNKVYNNVFYGTPEAGILVEGNAAVANNEVTNNIFMNCGEDSYDGDDYYAIEVLVGAGGNTFKNNLAFYSGVTDLFDYRGTPRTVAEFNGETGNNSDTMADNVGGDPLFTDAGAGDFTVPSTSPAVDAGVDVSLTSDYLSNAIRRGAGFDIGAYEYLYDDGVRSIGTGGAWMIVSPHIKVGHGLGWK